MGRRPSKRRPSGLTYSISWNYIKKKFRNYIINKKQIVGKLSPSKTFLRCQTKPWGCTIMEYIDEHFLNFLCREAV